MNAYPLTDVVRFLDETVPPHSHIDSSLNGLQIESPAQAVSHVSFAVDAGELVFEEAIKRGSQLLVVHHGVLWGSIERITGALARKLHLLLANGCSLYASHLPLDGSMSVGNGVELARILGFTQIEPAFPYKGNTIGVTAKTTEPVEIDAIIERARTLKGFSGAYAVRAGTPAISRVAIVTGSGAFALTEAKSLGVDLLISGEPKQEVFHAAHELKINALFLGHYATETVGVLALQRAIERQFKVKTDFIDIPTGI